MKTFTFILLLILTGCADVPTQQSMDEINPHSKDSVCIRECSAAFSDCVSNDSAVKKLINAIRHKHFMADCRREFQLCADNCPESESAGSRKDPIKKSSAAATKESWHFLAEISPHNKYYVDLNSLNQLPDSDIVNAWSKLELNQPNENNTSHSMFYHQFDCKMLREKTLEKITYFNNGKPPVSLSSENNDWIDAELGTFRFMRLNFICSTR